MDPPKPKSPEVFSRPQEHYKGWGKLTSINGNLDNVSLIKHKVKIGRHSSNDVVIRDIRVSGIHCMVKREENGIVAVEDLSANGSYIEGLKIGKGKAKILFPGDKLFLLHSSKVQKGEALGYILSVYDEEPNTLKRPREPNLEIKPLNSPNKEEKNSSSMQQDDLGEEMKCCICIDYIYNCVTALPCLHNFCAACYSEWMERSDNCPQCREDVYEIKKNSMVNNLINKFLDKHPDKKRSQNEYEEMDKNNQIHQDRLKINKKSPFKIDSGPNLKIRRDNNDRNNGNGGAGAGGGSNGQASRSSNANAGSNGVSDNKAAKLNALFSKFVA